MNLDEENQTSSGPSGSGNRKKLSRKEKKARKKAEKEAGHAEEISKPDPSSANDVESMTEVTPVEEGELHFEPAPVQPVPPPSYTLWERINPAARRRKQISNMETGFREVLGLVQSMRVNQEQLLESFKRLPDAVDSVKKLADHSAQQSEILKNMNEQMGGSGTSAGKFNETLMSMDQTTQLLLERAQRSEERLYGMLRRAQNRIAFMTFLVLLLVIGAAMSLYTFAPELFSPAAPVPDATATPSEETDVDTTSEPEPTSAPVDLDSAQDTETEPMVDLQPVLEPEPQTAEEIPLPPPAPEDVVPLSEPTPTPTPVPLPEDSDASEPDEADVTREETDQGQEAPDLP